MSKRYDGDYGCEVSEDERCHNEATQVYREPYTAARVKVPCCDEHGDGLRMAGYNFDKEATAKLAKDREREAAATQG